MASSGLMEGSRMRLAAALALAALAAGCVPTQAELDQGFASRGARDTGTYPNLNVAAPVASRQFDPYSLGQHNAKIAAAKQGQAAEGAAASASVAASEAQQARLRQLNQDKGQGVLNEIEGN